MKNLHHTETRNPENPGMEDAFNMNALLARGRQERSRAFHEAVRSALNLWK